MKFPALVSFWINIQWRIYTRDNLGRLTQSVRFKRASNERIWNILCRVPGGEGATKKQKKKRNSPLLILWTHNLFFFLSSFSSSSAILNVVIGPSSEEKSIFTILNKLLTCTLKTTMKCTVTIPNVDWRQDVRKRIQRARLLAVPSRRVSNRLLDVTERNASSVALLKEDLLD